MRRPEVRPEIRTLHGKARCLLDKGSKLSRALGFPRHNAMQPRVGAPAKAPLKLGNGEWEKGSDVGHDTLDTMPLGGRVNTWSTDFQKGHSPYPWGMDDIWPQRTIYRAHLEDYLEKSGKTQAQFCEEVGISMSHLHNNLYRQTKRLGLDVLQRSSAIFSKVAPGERSILNYIDDPGGVIGGQLLSDQSDQARFFTSLIVKDYRAEDLTDDDRRDLWQDHLRALERLRQFHARGTRSAGPDHPGGKPDGDGDLTGASPRRTPRPKG